MWVMWAKKKNVWNTKDDISGGFLKPAAMSPTILWEFNAKLVYSFKPDRNYIQVDT